MTIKQITKKYNNDYSKGLNTAYEYINNKLKELKRRC